VSFFRNRAGQLFPPFLLALWLVPAAAEPEAPREEDREPEVVHVTATRTRTPDHKVSAAAGAVEREQLRAGGPGVLPEMLRGVPGAWFQQTTPGQGIPVIRGLKGSQVLHLVDGMRVNNAFFRDAPNQYLGLVDAFAVDRIEWVRGASGSLYGADAMGGVVNFLTPEPGFRGRDWQSERSVYGSFDSTDGGLAFRAATRAGNERRGFAAGASWRHHGNRKTGGGGTVRPSGYRSAAVDFKWSGAVGRYGRLILSAQALEQPSTPRADELLPGFGRDAPAAELFLFRPNRREFLHARYAHDNPAGRFGEIQVNLARQVITDDRLTRDFGAAVTNDEHNKSTLDGLTLQFDRGLGGGGHLTWGLEYYADTVRSGRTEHDGATGFTRPVRARFPDRSTMDTAAAFASADWNPSGGWRLGAGVRYTHARLALPATTDNPEIRLSPGDVSGDLRMVRRLGPRLSLVTNLGRGFRPPNVFDLGTLGERPGDRFNVANPALGPETVRSYDLGLKGHAGDWQAEVFVYYLDYRDRIASVATGATTASGRTVVRSENLSRVQLHGVEAGFRWSPDPVNEWHGALNYTWGEERAPGGVTPADRIPPLNGRLGWTRHLSGQLTLDAFVLFAGRQDRLSPRDLDDPRINPAGTAGWATVNLHLAYRPAEDLELGLRLENLADRAYREHASGLDAPGRSIGAWAALGF